MVLEILFGLERGVSKLYLYISLLSLDSIYKLCSVLMLCPGRVESKTKTVEGRGGVINWEVSLDWRFQPPNTFLKQEGLRLAEASFRDDIAYII